MRLALIAAAVVCAVALPGCGSSGGDDGGAARTVGPGPQSSAPRGPLELPRGIPLRSSGTANPAQAKVIRDWASALRGGDIAAASALWAVPSKVQNGTPVLALRSRDAVALFNSSLPCGARVTDSAGAPRGFTIVTVRLTRRRGGDCGSGAGNSARTAIRVRDGRIVEWYRLPDDSDDPTPAPRPAPGGADSTPV